MNPSLLSLATGKKQSKLSSVVLGDSKSRRVVQVSHYTHVEGCQTNIFCPYKKEHKHNIPLSI